MKGLTEMWPYAVIIAIPFNSRRRLYKLNCPCVTTKSYVVVQVFKNELENTYKVK